MIYAIAVLAPLVGSLIAGLFGRAIGDRAAQAVAILFMLLAAVCGDASWIDIVWNNAPFGVVSLGNWIDVGQLHVDWALRYDTLSVTMVAMVTTVSTLIHIYSVGYMGHEPSNTTWRFFSFLSAFTFSMLMLVTADNLVQLFFGWEGVGLMSYLLIGYWYDRPAANAAAIKAFVVNRVGDLFFALGIALTLWTFGSVQFANIFPNVADHQNDLYTLFGTQYHSLEVIGVLLFIGAMGKSAQLGLHVWLPDAMEGPTPVSALIHAATMVTAGVFMIARMSPIMEYAPGALDFVCFIGASTALFAATIGCVQNDIKRVIAYSTCSQLGYMFIAAGVGAFQVSIFHLITHAFFKALLFLCAGSVIHAMHDEQDIRKMGGIWKKIPITYTCFWIGSLALAGVIPFAGYYSKDAIIEASYAADSGVGTYAFVCGVLAAFLTAFYSWRVIIVAFHGKPRMDNHTFEHVHESPFVMTVPLMLLAVGATTAGFLLKPLFIGADWHEFWRGAIFVGANNHVLERMEQVPALVSILPSIVGILGIFTAWVFYVGMPTLPVQLANTFRPIYLFLLNKWYFDELYDAIIVRPYQVLARQLWQVGDATIIDGVPNGIAAMTVEGSSEVSRLQSGSLAAYAFVMLIGVVLLVGLYMVIR
jgi:NADH-quinone oxidoreductase subunit L